MTQEKIISTQELNPQKKEELNTALYDFYKKIELADAKVEDALHLLNCETDFPLTLDPLEKANAMVYQRQESTFIAAQFKASSELNKISEEVHKAFTKLISVEETILPDDTKTEETKAAHNKYKEMESSIEDALKCVQEKHNPFPKRRRRLQIRPFLMKLTELELKEEELSKIVNPFYNTTVTIYPFGGITGKKPPQGHPDYIEVKERIKHMNHMRLELIKIGVNFIEGKLNLKEFKEQVSSCINNSEDREILNKHRHPKVAEFIAILKNIISVIALFIPIIINKGFYKKEPTNTSRILDSLENTTACLN